jgi:hypothetical protein
LAVGTYEHTPAFRKDKGLSATITGDQRFLGIDIQSTARSLTSSLSMDEIFAAYYRATLLENNGTWQGRVK